MKKFVCEICDGTDLLKKEGVFICQNCGTKYSAEEVKANMKEVEGDDTSTTVKNSEADKKQVDNLMNLAKNSFDSKNFSKAEEYCNKVIEVDSENYDAWLLKGDAVSNQSAPSTNDRSDEVYNCFITAYRVLGDKDKEKKRESILSKLYVSSLAQLTVCVQLVEAKRPKLEQINRVKNLYNKLYNNLEKAYDEVGMKKEGKEKLQAFANAFITAVDLVCASAWKTTVGYNYYRDYFNANGCATVFNRTLEQQKWVIKNTNLYRPIKITWDTFLNELDNLVELIAFTEQQYNDATDPKTIKSLLSKVEFYETHAIESGSWRIMTGFTSNWDQFQSVGWHEEYNLNYEAKELRKKLASKYSKKSRDIPKKLKENQKAKEEKAIKEKADKYWSEHKEEKEQLENEKKELESKIKKQDKEIEEKKKRINEIEGKEFEVEKQVEKTKAEKKVKERELDSLSFFKRKEKIACEEKIVELSKTIKEKEKQAKEEREKYIEDTKEELEELKTSLDELEKEYKKNSSRIKKINKTLKTGK